MAETVRTQYQHFVPQFLLKNFSHIYKPSKDERKKPKNSEIKDDKRIYRGDRVVNTLDLTEDVPIIQEARVNRILGQMDMYRDNRKPSSEQQHVEQMFSKLECQASVVFRGITKAFDENKNEVWLTRADRDLVRKFLFLLKYRGSGFHQRFYHDTAEDYNSDDREPLRDYWQKRVSSVPWMFGTII